MDKGSVFSVLPNCSIEEEYSSKSGRDWQLSAPEEKMEIHVCINLRRKRVQPRKNSKRHTLDCYYCTDETE